MPRYKVGCCYKDLEGKLNMLHRYVDEDNPLAAMLTANRIFRAELKEKATDFLFSNPIECPPFGFPEAAKFNVKIDSASNLHIGDDITCSFIPEAHLG